MRTLPVEFQFLMQDGTKNTVIVKSGCDQVTVVDVRSSSHPRVFFSGLISRVFGRGRLRQREEEERAQHTAKIGCDMARVHRSSLSACRLHMVE